MDCLAVYATSSCWKNTSFGPRKAWAYNPHYTVTRSWCIASESPPSAAVLFIDITSSIAEWDSPLKIVLLQNWGFVVMCSMIQLVSMYRYVIVENSDEFRLLDYYRSPWQYFHWYGNYEYVLMPWGQSVNRILLFFK